AEYIRIYGGKDETPMEVGEFDPPAGSFLVAYAAGSPVAMGGWRFRPDVEAPGGKRPAEIKRMFVVAERRRTGLARFVLQGLEESAAAAGADVMILETGRPQIGAEEFYRSNGYADTVRFGFYAQEPHTVYLGKTLHSASNSSSR
ncbi:MAG: GNAT family N-acetyltransferase, partial [Nocardioides sp.]